MLFYFDPNDQQESMKLIENLTENAGKIQQQVLKDILNRNSDTEYLHGFLHGVRDVHQFKKSVPVVDYEQIKPYIDRIANGEPSNIISSEPITELLTSSGTSGGKPKIMPTTAKELDRKTFFYNLLIPVMNQYVEGLDEGKAMYLLFVKPEISTPSGLMARPVLTSYYKSDHFRHRPLNKFNIYTSPDDTILCPDSKQSMHCQLLCGLVQRKEVLRVGAIFASAFLRAIKYFEDHWLELCTNIRTGQVSKWITDDRCRSAVLKVLNKPDSELASLIEMECSKDSWEGIIKKIWPRTKYIDVIVTGSMAQYIPLLEFYGGGLPLISTMYGSSECYFGINLEPLCSPSEVSYTLLPNMAYFEFLPVDHDYEEAQALSNGSLSSLQNRVVDLVDVQLGHCYELIVTTFTGLYRYRVGDILMVTGFNNAAPQFQFMQRRNVVLSIDTDKTSEEDLLKAVTQAKLLLQPHGHILTEYTSYAETSSLPGHYVLFWEVKAKGGNEPVNKEVMEACCMAVEARLDSVYRRCRSRDGSIGPLEIRVVKCGAFDELMDFCVASGSSVNQYKTPRCIKTLPAIQVLERMVVGRFFSREAPFWEPQR
ncbi:indole-3-acetic acid-amido synthetase GH3.17-like [Dioscorea cayenensis subsp. rotundata]|uniref:Indole-3-acetic acid-amido synthetase GH3.17-like n=1 Tax=Dioscorea cayennensis subsp. rotundata TaxID=55577 RepID=A0AB40BB09_DIOCR|nr:indole-3-acetic acid-amido synthetase GH3.17-like [Dioscorea cayenensis subsp. rotundata]